MQYQGINLQKLKHASFLINFKGLNIYLDPFKIEDNFPKADYIFITHNHFDHFSPPDVKKILKESTKIISVQSVINEIRNWTRLSDLVVVPNKDYNFDEINFRTLPAYNVNKFKSANEVFHPREVGNVGYILKLDNILVYHAGDTDFIEEMKDLKDINIALVPVSGIYVMTAEEAAQAVNTFRPEIAMPMHYGEIVGTIDDANKFKELSKVEVVFS